MTSTVNELTRRLLGSGDHAALATGIEVIVLALLVVLLVEYELVRAYRGQGASTVLRSFEPFIPPLLIAFVAIVAARLLHLH